MTSATPEPELQEAAGRLVDDQEYMNIDAPDPETEQEDNDGEG